MATITIGIVYLLQKLVLQSVRYNRIIAGAPNLATEQLNSIPYMFTQLDSFSINKKCLS